MSKLNVAIIQNNAIADYDLNCKKAYQAVDEAISNNATFILLPETFPYRAQSEQDARIHSETLDGAVITELRAKAKAHHVFILAGSIAEKNPHHDQKVFNTSVLINNEGDIDSVYRKIHLFDAEVLKQYIKIL